ncbi:class I SAM-dependent methyltransferase [Actinomadura sp. HBU206391]|uniref:class I SAM-dependent methyltransferase n=1 Tax=Actinomadura sp. HBU206391 TaxID=2731692 RepID=UPI00164F888C|nr:class I SAM-dependent methyltransferase [Actinomadura sp. HBU206391]MBC6456987.1 class I SAM-dependent methyltransferase [Actinomadura sp. HBU206391]
MAEYWNHNVAYHPVVLDAVPAGCAAALDIGCGDGLLVRKLAARAGRVTGLDRSAPMIDLARRLSAGIGNTSFVEADLLAHDLPAGGYDFVCAVATVHHMDFTRAVTEMARLVRPGGRLAIVGLARNHTPLDWLISGFGVPVAQANRLRPGRGDPADVPMMDPDMSWGQVRAEADRLLPGARFRRHLLWRYSVLWTKH